MEDNKHCATLNYEAEYEKVSVELRKANDENFYLRDELKQKDREMAWLYGFKNAIEVVFGKDGCNG